MDLADVSVRVLRVRAGPIGGARRLKAITLRVNQVDLVDVDAASGRRCAARLG